MSDKEKLEYVIPYLRDMATRGDDEAKFLLRMFGDNWEEPEDE